MYPSLFLLQYAVLSNYFSIIDDWLAPNARHSEDFSIYQDTFFFLLRFVFLNYFSIIGDRLAPNAHHSENFQENHFRSTQQLADNLVGPSID